MLHTVLTRAVQTIFVMNTTAGKHSLKITLQIFLGYVAIDDNISRYFEECERNQISLYFFYQVPQYRQN